MTLPVSLPEILERRRKGDSDLAAEDKNGADVQKIDFYKAAHHGSRYSNSTGFLETLAPEIALVSCSRTNRYGHPSKEAVGHMQQAGSQVYYTMESGRLCVKDGRTSRLPGVSGRKEQWWQ